MGLGWLALVLSLALFLAWNLGANDVANAMGTSVGSKVITLRQAIVLAGILEFAGAVFLGRAVTATLTETMVSLPSFAGQADLFPLSVVAELLATSLWLLGATNRGWPVASSHAAIGAIIGINLFIFGWGALDPFVLGTITLSWALTPAVSGILSAGFFLLLQHGLLNQRQPLDRWHHWNPWISITVIGLVGGLVLPTVVAPLVSFTQQRWSWSLPAQDYGIGLGLLGVWGLTYWTPQSPQSSPTTEQNVLEGYLGKFQLVSAGCMAFAHGSNDVGNAIAPLASFVAFWPSQTVPAAAIAVPLWTLVLGGIGIVMGLATWGRRVIGTVGERLIPLRPSHGFCAELGAATTVLLASHWGLPVSTTHALVGSVVGIGLVQGAKTLNWSTVRQIAAAWVITTPAAMALGAGLFWGLRSLFLG